MDVVRLMVSPGDLRVTATAYHPPDGQEVFVWGDHGGREYDIQLQLVPMPWSCVRMRTFSALSRPNLRCWGMPQVMPVLPQRGLFYLLERLS